MSDVYRPQPGDTITYAIEEERPPWFPLRVLARNPDHADRFVAVDQSGDVEDGYDDAEDCGGWVKVVPLPDIPERWINLYSTGWSSGSPCLSRDEADAAAVGNDRVAVVHVGMRDGVPFAEIERVQP